MRSSDTVARFGGDEFGILLEDIAGEQDAIEMAERIAGVFARPFVLDGNEHFVTTSIGIALAEGGERAEDLIRDADAAMYRAKERGRARYELFDEAHAWPGLIERLRVENDLRRALERDELTPRTTSRWSRCATARSSASRRCVRWDHPERGRISPVGLHPGRRGERADRADRPLGARARLPPGGRVVPRAPRRRAADDVGQPVRRPGGQPRAARDRRHRPARLGPGPGLPGAWS